jgi:hypothetical protein
MAEYQKGSMLATGRLQPALDRVTELKLDTAADFRIALPDGTTISGQTTIMKLIPILTLATADEDMSSKLDSGISWAVELTGINTIDVEQIEVTDVTVLDSTGQPIEPDESEQDPRPTDELDWVKKLHERATWNES